MAAWIWRCKHVSPCRCLTYPTFYCFWFFLSLSPFLTSVSLFYVQRDLHRCVPCCLMAQNYVAFFNTLVQLYLQFNCAGDVMISDWRMTLLFIFPFKCLFNVVARVRKGSWRNILLVWTWLGKTRAGNRVLQEHIIIKLWFIACLSFPRKV